LQHLINTGKKSLTNFMNCALHISNLQPSGYRARGRGMGFGMGSQVMFPSALTQVGTDRATK